MAERIKYNDDFSYELYDDGYDIYNGDSHIITQHDPYGKPFDKSKSYEENCLIQLEQMTTPVEPTPDQVEINKANIEYLALMTDVELLA